MKSTPHEFQLRLSKLLAAKTEKLSELLVAVGVEKSDLIENADFSNLNLSDDNLSGFRFQATNFDHCNFERTVFRHSNFNNCSLDESSFLYAVLSDAELNDLVLGGQILRTSFERARLLNVKVNGCEFHECAFSGAIIMGSKLSGVHFLECMLRNVKVIESSVNGITFTGSAMQYGVWEGLNLRDVTVSACTLDELSFIGSSFNNFEIDDESTVVNTKFSTDCGLPTSVLMQLVARGAMLVDDPDEIPHPTSMKQKQVAVG